jgi:hypothetical protein
MLVGLAAVAGISILAVVLFAWDRGRDGESVPTADGEPAIEARTDLSPRIVLFGDTVKAFVDVTLDRNRVDPDSVRVLVDFAPWKRLANPERVRQDGETTTSIRTTYVLRCVTNACISDDAAAVQNDTELKVFEQAQVTYTASEGRASTSRVSLQVPWPRLTVGARFSARDALSAGASTSGWRVDLLSLPAFSYRVTPGLLFALLLAAGIVLAIAGGAFVHRARRRRAPPAPVGADGPSEPVVTPLDRALALLEDSARLDGAADQRRALELVAAALDGRGDLKLARESRALAWSEPVPGVRETNGVAARARSALRKELHERAA